ncbi:MAG: hypothetical protein EZS28_038874, partial [Streblomastix strix]
RITSLSFHPNYNSLILSSSSDKTCAVWSTGEESVRIDRNDLIQIGEQQKKKNEKDQLQEKEKEKDKSVGLNIDRIQDRNERGWSSGQENKKTEWIDRNWPNPVDPFLTHDDTIHSSCWSLSSEVPWLYLSVSHQGIAKFGSVSSENYYNILFNNIKVKK